MWAKDQYRYICVHVYIAQRVSRLLIAIELNEMKFWLMKYIKLASFLKQIATIVSSEKGMRLFPKIKKFTTRRKTCPKIQFLLRQETKILL